VQAKHEEVEAHPTVAKAATAMGPAKTEAETEAAARGLIA